MSDVVARNQQYDYKNNSNLVIHTARVPRDLREPKGDPESLWGKLQGSMGDRVNYSRPTELLEKVATLKRKTQDKSARVQVESSVNNHKRSKGAPVDILEATDSSMLGMYRPKTRETRIVYERLITFVQSFVGDQPMDIIRGAVEEIIGTMKNDKLRAPDKKKDISLLLRGLNEEKFTELTRIVTGITDYKESSGEASTHGDTLDDAHGVAVIIDEDDDDGNNLSDYELKDEEDDDDDNDDGDFNQKRGEQGDVDGDIQDPKDDDENNETDRKRQDGDDKDQTNKALNPLEIDAFWIQRKISTFEEDALQAQKLAERVIQTLRQPDVRRCENDLVNLFDITKFDFIKLLLNNRQTILYCTLLAKSENDQERKKIEDEMTDNPVLFTILNKIKGLDQQQQPIEKKKLDAVVKQKEKDQNNNNQQQQKIPKKQLDLDELTFQQGGHLMTNKKFQFPAGSKRETYKGYEEIHVPARANPPFNNNERLIAISELPEWARSPFKGFEKLNRVQSRLYEWAFKTNDNLLLSAPTSAGKTNVAMLTILHEIGMHMSEDGYLDRDSFKIVYIAPMKSLVQEMVANFSNRLKDYGIVVKELTGDQSLTNKQIAETQIIVTTPEKWDIITRKSGERAYTQLVRLVIIDEIHLLHDERGPVLECIVARTLRMIESTQEMVRLVGLSATLPNYEDVATFLRVKPEGIFYFDASYRPIPLEQQYIGVSERGYKQLQTMNDVTYKKVSERAGVNQILIFVHSRRETGKTARDIRDRAVDGDLIGQLLKRADSREILREEADKTARNAELKELLPYGIGIHHAGLSRSDRTLVEELFADQHLQVLVSTATLAWGVNLPAHTVIIKGTQVYNTEKGWTELSPLDVTQMLGRAGRPPFDKEGEGIVITTQAELQFYLSLINTQLSIESQFISRLADNLNAEVVSGSVQSVRDAVHWLGYTYLFICMLRNPPLYEISYDEIAGDEELEQRRIDLVHSAALQLDKNNLIKYDRRTGRLQATELGRVASHYYITNASMAVYHEHLRPVMSDIDFFRLFSLSSEFKTVVVREGEKAELEKLLERVPIPVKESVDEPAAKINVLLQAYISNLKLEGFALIVDMFYVAQSAARIARALYDIVLRKGWSQLARKVLNVCRMVDRRMWVSQSPLRQFPEISERIVNQLERRQIPIEDLYEYNSAQLGTAIQNQSEGKALYKLIHHFPKIDLTAHVQPILHGLLRVDLTLQPDFEFDEKYHGTSIGWWILVEDVDGERILYNEFFSLKKRMMEDGATISFTVPLTTPMPPQYYVRVLADRWIGAEYSLAISFKHLILPDKYPPCRRLLDLQPLSIDSLKDDRAISVFRPHFRYFNAVQTQVFSALYSSDENVMLAAPANSGKTACAELAMLRTLIRTPDARCVYIAPVNSLANLRARDWAFKFSAFGKVSMLTGDTVTDNKLLEMSRIICTTADKWDILSRKWRQRNSRISSVNLFIVDEMQMIGAGESGATLEIVVSRMRYIATQTGVPMRFVALSSPVANSRDLAEWMGATPSTMFDFHPDVRPIELEIQLQGFDYPNFQERQMAMTKPTLYAVANNRAGQTLVFVPTRKVARQMAADIIVFVTSEEDAQKSKHYLALSDEELEPHLRSIESKALRESLAYGVGIYHDGLTQREKRVVEALFKSGAIKVMVATHSECWALDVHASLVVVMGTQMYQGGGNTHADYPINDLLQMLARAGKQGVDEKGRCLLLCHAPKKEYYKMFLNEPLPVESHLDHFLADHFNAEIASRTISKKQDALDYLTWSFMYRRFTQNPNYYNLTGTTHLHLSEHMSELVENTLIDLSQANCITIKEEEVDEEQEQEEEQLAPTNLGMIASYYYLKYTTVELFASSLKATTKRKGILEILSTAPEFSSIIVRHRENSIIKKMAAHLPLKIDRADYDSFSTKVNVLLQAHFSRLPVSADLHVDQQQILEHSTRLLQAIVDVISSSGWLQPALSAMELSQMCTQAVWDSDSYLKQLPHMTTERLQRCKQSKVDTVFELMGMDDGDRDKLLQMSTPELEDLAGVCMRFPDIDVNYRVAEEDDIHHGQPVVVEVEVERDIDDEQINESINVVHAPFYPKERIGGWWVIVGDEKSNQLLSIKRLTLTKKAKLKLDFPAPPVGKHSLTIFLMSDSYTGCDQVYNIDIIVKPALIESDDDQDEEEDKMEE